MSAKRRLAGVAQRLLELANDADPVVAHELRDLADEVHVVKHLIPRENTVSLVDDSRVRIVSRF